jgi:hypothetical protein
MHEEHNLEDDRSGIPLTKAEPNIEITDKGERYNIPLQNTTKNKSCACGKGEGCSCGSDTGKNPLYVYAIGKVVHRFPTRSLELELAQATGRRPVEETRGRTREVVIH